jgi:Flp pilus assembly protein TadD
MSLDPAASVAANNLASLYTEGGDNLDRALALAQVAKSGLPDSPEVADTLGWAYYKKGMYAQAVTALKEAADKQPDNALFHYHLGLAAAKKFEVKLARNALEAGLKLNPQAKEAAEARTALALLSSIGS